MAALTSYFSKSSIRHPCTSSDECIASSTIVIEATMSKKYKIFAHIDFLKPYPKE
jgi:hypothetical protein